MKKAKGSLIRGIGPVAVLLSILAGCAAHGVLPPPPPPPPPPAPKSIGVEITDTVTAGVRAIAFDYLKPGLPPGPGNKTRKLPGLKRNEQFKVKAYFPATVKEVKLGEFRAVWANQLDNIVETWPDLEIVMTSSGVEVPAKLASVLPGNRHRVILLTVTVTATDNPQTGDATKLVVSWDDPWDEYPP